MPGKGPFSRRLTPFRIALTYVIVASAWIVLSDSVVSLLYTEQVFALQMSKGAFFVFATGVMLYAMVRSYCRVVAESEAAEREYAEQVVSQNTLLQSVIDSMPDVLTVTDNVGRILLTSPAWSARDECRDRDLRFEDWPRKLGLYRPDGNTLFNANDLPTVRATAGEKAGRTVLLMRPPTGEPPTWFSLTAQPLLHEPTGLRGAVTIWRDISKLIEAEERLARSEFRFRSLIENAQDIVAVLDADQRIAYVSPAITPSLGYSAEELHGRPILDLVHETDVSTAREALETVIRQPEIVWRRESRVRHRSGDWHYFEVIGSGMRDDAGQPVAILNCRDISERKKAEERLRWLAAAVEQCAETIIITDSQGIIEYVNPAFEEISGYSRTEAIGQTPKLLKSGAQPQGFYVEMWDTIQRGKTWQGRFVNRRKDGSLYEEQAVISPVKDKRGGIASFVAVKRDVTREVRLEAQMLQRQKLEAIGTLAGGIAHDFNNILGAIVGYTDMARIALEPNSSAASDLAEVLRAAKRAKDLVTQILTFSRQNDSEKQSVRLSSIVREVIRLLKATLPATITIDTHIETTEDTIHADPSQLHQVVMNLCTNAYHAMRQTGGVLSIAIDTINLDANDIEIYDDLGPGRFVRLVVADTGIGMDRDTISRIFEPFFTTKGEAEGTGLGLSTAHGIVAGHGGTITVYSEPGAGSTFRVYLPKSESSAEVASTTDDSVIIPGNGERILLVDDEEPLLNVGKRVLERFGYAVSVRSNALEGLEAFRAGRESFDLVISDQTMPKMSGLEFAQQIRTIHKDVPIILTTGFSETLTEERIRALGIAEVVLKPILARDLAAAVQRAIRKRRA